MSQLSVDESNEVALGTQTTHEKVVHQPATSKTKVDNNAIYFKVSKTWSSTQQSETIHTTSYGIRTVESCQEACSNTSGCSHFTHNATEGTYIINLGFCFVCFFFFF